MSFLLRRHFPMWDSGNKELLLCLQLFVLRWVARRRLLQPNTKNDFHNPQQVMHLEWTAETFLSSSGSHELPPPGEVANTNKAEMRTLLMLQPAPHLLPTEGHSRAEVWTRWRCGCTAQAVLGGGVFKTSQELKQELGLELSPTAGGFSGLQRFPSLMNTII